MVSIKNKVKQLGLMSVTSILCVMLYTPSNAADADCSTYGPYTCKQGYVWREATADDKVCVTPDVRKKTKRENQLHSMRVDPNSNKGYCKSGYVWREARQDDHVCVTPASRDRAKQDNRNAYGRMACPPPIQ